MIDLAGNTETAVPGSATDYAFSRVAGAPTTPWVFFENSAHQLAGYFPATGVTTVLGDRCCGVALVTIRQ